MPTITIHQQAQAAHSAITHFVVTLGTGEAPSDEKLRDTLTGLMHLCDEHRESFDKLLQKARDLYEREVLQAKCPHDFTTSCVPDCRCERCGKEHSVIWHEFKNPTSEWTHWGICQNTGDPVMMSMVLTPEKGDNKQQPRRAEVLTCAFCGHEYPPGTPPTQHEALTAHVRVCEKHPLRAEIEQLKAKIADMSNDARERDERSGV